MQITKAADAPRIFGCRVHGCRSEKLAGPSWGISRMIDSCGRQLYHLDAASNLVLKRPTYMNELLKPGAHAVTARFGATFVVGALVATREDPSPKRPEILREGEDSRCSP
jgi:hypothetical protein